MIKSTGNLLVFSLLVISCAIPAPKLKHSYLPIRYTESSVPWSLQIKETTNLNFVPINLVGYRNRNLIVNWRRGVFDPIFKKRHPVVNVRQSDIDNLAINLNKVLLVYYAQLEPLNPQISDDLRRQVKKHLNCEPLSNLEIRFIMNADTLTVFAQKPLSMLLISAHELMLQMGSTPEYPKVVSPFLRKKYGYAELKKMEDGNIFAVKKSLPLQSKDLSGFIVCRREA